MDTNKMRDTYEAWAIQDASSVGRDLVIDREGDWYIGKDAQFLNLGWASWKASREAVVVELPSACAYEGLTEHLGSLIELSYEAPEHDPVGLARLPDVREAIVAQGLKVAP
ncbi:hypothetical protein [Pseudomonas urethralis]|uniref:hypothetical protein n=1 Tax=Pseudomonas urethralis TaxID=2740517 RepID=UPI001596AC26|nr:hypothetical protein [Pseudomonas urethralis]